MVRKLHDNHMHTGPTHHITIHKLMLAVCIIYKGYTYYNIIILYTIYVHNNIGIDYSIFMYYCSVCCTYCI